MTLSTALFEAVANRRSVYALADDLPISQARVKELVFESLKYCPSAFNVRSSRCIILFGDEHRALWDHAAEVTPKTAPKALYDLLVPRISIFKPAAGTILFFEDPEAIEDLPLSFQPLFEEYPDVANHAAGMLQFIVWTALAAEGVACNIQHYQPHITEYLKGKYDVPGSWKLNAQLVFGQQIEGPGPEKPRTHLDKALLSFGENAKP